jgi:hypothetical protein
VQDGTVTWASRFAASPFQRYATNASLLEIDSASNCNFNLQADGLAYGVWWKIRGNSNQLNQNQVFNDTVFTNMRVCGFYVPTAIDGNPATLDQIVINQPYVEVNGPALYASGTLVAGVPSGVGISGSNITVSNMEINGGRMIVADPVNGACINFEPPSASSPPAPSSLQLLLSGDVQLTGGARAISLAPNQGGSVSINATSAALQQTAGAGSGALNFDTSAADTAITFSALGAVSLQASGVGPGYTSTGSATLIQGLFCRGFADSIPTVAGSVGEYFVASSPSSSVTFWRCTTAGAAGVAVWTAFV